MFRIISDTFDGEPPLRILGQFILLVTWLYALLQLVTLWAAAQGAL